MKNRFRFKSPNIFSFILSVTFIVVYSVLRKCPFHTSGDNATTLSNNACNRNGILSNQSKLTIPTATALQKNATKSGLAIDHVSIIDWKKTDMNSLTTSQIIDYLLWTNQSSCQVTQYFGGNMVFRGYTVSYDGQKAVCLDNFIAPLPTSCLVYSFGIGNEWSFDEAMELYGCDVFSFDPTMNISNYNRTEYIHFFQMALDSVDRDKWREEIADAPSRTLFSIYNMLHSFHETKDVIDYLKLDIEYAEWWVLPQIIKSGMMDKVRQLNVEIHIDFDKPIGIYREYAVSLQSLEHYGMVRFDSKRNLFTVVDFTQANNVKAAVDYEIAWYNSRLSRN